MGIGDFVNKAKDKLTSEQAERFSDSALDRGAKFASARTGGKHDEKIQSLRDSIDERIGTEGRTSPTDRSTEKVSDPGEAKSRLDADQQL